MDGRFSELPTVPASGLPRGHAPHELVWPLGTVLDGRWEVRRVLGGPGHSGMGVVYVVAGAEGLFAAKTFQSQHALNLHLIRRFLREAHTWILVGFHPNIVRAYTVEIIDALPYLFMEYVEAGAAGGSLAERTMRGPHPIPETLDLALQCCDALVHAGASVPGLVHRDLKPENLLIAADGTLKVTDFGLVRGQMDAPLTQDPQAEGAPGLTAVGSTLGTPAYMAPEQFANPDHVTHLADQYAFGCCFYEALTGGRVYTITGATPAEHIASARSLHTDGKPAPLRERIPGCTRELDETVMRCMEKDPSRRWPDFGTLRDRLLFILERQYATPYRPRTIPDPSPRDVAVQVRALTVLEGYERAVRRKHLREGHAQSPYAFHLALASYFRVEGEREEERRQLEKAARIRGEERGYEVVRRLAALLLEEERLDEAEALLAGFLQRNPESTHLVLEPKIGLLLRRERFGEAERLLGGFERTLRIDGLYAELYARAGRHDDLVSLLESRAESVLAQLCDDVRQLTAGDRPGWSAPDDPATLAAFLAETAPDLDCALLTRLDGAIWPDLSGDPDFTGPMAWLSEIHGRLGEAAGGHATQSRERARRLGALLGYPERLKSHLLRDEEWLWRQPLED